MDRPPGPAAHTHLADLIAGTAARVPDHPAIVDVSSATTLSWADFDRAGTAEAQRLRASGVGTGDRVAIRLPGGAAYCVALLGALRVGATVVPYGPVAVLRELELVFSDCGPRVVVALAGDAAAATAAAGAGATLLGPPDLDARAVSADRAPGGGEGIALLIYTSGSTGTPRGVRLSHRAVLANREQTAALRPAPITPVDRVMLALPMFHIFGLGAGFLQVCWAGATVVITDRWDAELLAEVIVAHRVSSVAGVPSTFRALLDLPAELLRVVTANLRLCTSGGAPLPPRSLAEFRSVTGLSIVEGYGLTEASPVVTSNAVDGVPKPGAVGRPLPGIELRLVGSGDETAVETGDDNDHGRDDRDRGDSGDVDGDQTDGDHTDGDHTDGNQTGGRGRTGDRDQTGDGDEDDFDAADGTGLVVIRGRNLFSGYWPDGAGGPDAEGWFRTTDVGFLDADGDLHLVDRSSDLVIVNGFNVYPREVEQVLADLPGVAEAAVVGVPDERTGAAVRAVLVLAAGSTLTEEEVRTFCGQQLARFKVPAIIEFVDVLPRTPTGKVARRQLADWSVGPGDTAHG